MTDVSQTSIQIRAERSAFDPDACKFVVDRPIHKGDAVFFGSAQEASGSPLATRLFSVGGIANVLVSDNVVTVAKTQSQQWSDLLRPIGQAIREQLLSGVEPIGQGPKRPDVRAESDAEIEVVLRELLDREINPQIAHHRGQITLERVENKTAYVRMHGGCQGCAASKVTLRHGVEVLVHQVLPDVRIEDATDHTSGQAAYFKALPS